MANREALIPDVNGGEGLELAHWTNSTVQMWEECRWQQREDGRPGDADMDNQTKTPIMANCEKANSCLHTCHSKLWEQHLCLMDSEDLEKSGTSRRTPRDPSTEQTKAKNKQDARGIHAVVFR